MAVTDEADRLDIGVCQDSVHGFLVAVGDVEDAGGQASLQGKAPPAASARWGRARRASDEGVAASDGGGGLPERDHGREVERRDARHHAQRLAHGIHVDARAGQVREVALHEMRNADGELDHLQPALNVAEAVRNRLSMLGRKQLGQRLHFLGDDFEELHHHAGAALRVLRGPGGLGGLGVGDDLRDLGRAGEGNARLNLARMRSVNVREPALTCPLFLAPREMVNCAHDAPPSGLRCRSLKSMGAGPGVQVLKPGWRRRRSYCPTFVEMWGVRRPQKIGKKSHVRRVT